LEHCFGIFWSKMMKSVEQSANTLKVAGDASGIYGVAKIRTPNDQRRPTLCFSAWELVGQHHRNLLTYFLFDLSGKMKPRPPITRTQINELLRVRGSHGTNQQVCFGRIGPKQRRNRLQESGHKPTHHLGTSGQFVDLE
jgi:hypothetical protein